MFVGAYRVELFFPASRSLKEKRSILNRMKSRLAQLNLAVAEVDGQDLWQRSSLGVAAVSSDSVYLDDLPGKIESVVLRDTRANLLRVDRDVRPVAF
jgi:uncharacterized protein YlxP (DUF503 family)